MRIVSVVFVILSLVGCASYATLSIGLDSESRVSVDLRTSSIGRFRNNSTVRLEPGTYRGDLVIDANRVTLIGAGTGRTVINGDVRITGNSCTLRDVRVRGNVYIEGNNADLTNIIVDGRIH